MPGSPARNTTRRPPEAASFSRWVRTPRSVSRPWKPLIGDDAKRDGTGGPFEDREGGVALTPRLQEHAAEGRNRGADDGIVTAQRLRHRRRVCVPHRRRAFDVGQQKRDDTAGETGGRAFARCLSLV